MIFSKFFKAKWQHKDSNVRITTINNDLDNQNLEDKAVLEKLITDDSNELVRRAALIKMHSFEQWLLASQNNSNDKVKKYAQQQISLILQNEHSIKLSLMQKQEYLQQTSTIATLEAWLHHELDADLIIALFEKINKPQLVNVLFNDKTDIKVQSYFVGQTSTLPLLEKLAKKTCNENVIGQINDKINDIKALKEKPVKLKKQLQLLLAKLLALKELADFGEYKEKQQLLVTQWHLLGSELDCLDNNDQTTIIDKYQDINRQLTQVFAPKEEAYIQAEIAQQLIADKKSAQNKFDQKLKQFSQELTTSVFENNSIDEPTFASNLNNLKQEIENSVLNNQEKQSYFTLIETESQRLSQLPEIAESVSQATHLISKISQVLLPQNLDELNDRQTFYNAWLKDWQVVHNKTKGVLPDYIKVAYQDITKQWQNGLKPLQQQQKTQFSYSQKKLFELKRLLSTGKFNASFGVFKRVKQSFSQLSVAQQHKLQRDFDDINEQINELSDLEHFIATPRKQQLLTDIQALVEMPLDNPNEQAKKVKQFRQAWNLLGHADEDLDKELNQAFNTACEQAFAPCRLFFADQEKLREQHYNSRVSIIDSIGLLADKLQQQPIDFKNLDGQLNKLHQQWQDAGQVDREKYKTLQYRYTKASQPLKAAISNFQQQNASAKQNLIELANQAVENDNVFEAIELVKKLQGQWRDIGYAGSRQENKLWQTFRNINDQLFKKRDDLKADEKLQQLKSQQLFTEQLSQLQLLLTSSVTVQEVKVIQEQANALLVEVHQIKPPLKGVLMSLDKFIKTLEQKIVQVNQAQQQQIWHDIFAVLASIAHDNVAVDRLDSLAAFKTLPISWQKQLNGTYQEKSNGDRQLSTLELEILAGIDSPSEYAQQRMEVQVKMMQKQMTARSELDVQQQFSLWLKQGPFTQQDLSLIDRVKVVFCQ